MLGQRRSRIDDRYEMLDRHGAVVDHAMGLMWMQEHAMQVFPDFGRACAYVERVNISGEIAGFNDWRIPTRREMESLADRRFLPVVNGSLFPDTEGNGFWATSEDGAAPGVWCVVFAEHGAYPIYGGQNGAHLLRLVRNQRSR
jgi:hypothetical protein